MNHNPQYSKIANPELRSVYPRVIKLTTITDVNAKIVLYYIRFCYKKYIR